MKPRWTMFALVFVAGYLAGVSHHSARPRRAPSHVATASKAEAAMRPMSTIDSVLGVLTQAEGYERFAQMGAAMDSLDSPTIAELATRLLAPPEEEWEKTLPDLVEAWCHRDARAASDWMRQYFERTRFPRSGDFDDSSSNAERALIQAWARNATDEALAYALNDVETFPGIQILSSVLLVPPRPALEDGVKLLRQLPSKAQVVLAANFFNFEGEVDWDVALAAATSLSDGDARDTAVAAVLRGWLRSDPIKVLERMGQLGNRAEIEQIAHAAMSADPVKAAAWLDRQPLPANDSLRGILAMVWAGQDPAAAFRWAVDHGLPLTVGIPRIRNYNGMWEVLMGPLQVGASRAPVETLAWIRGQPAGPDRDQLMKTVVETMGPRFLLEVVAELPPEAADRMVQRAGKFVPLEELLPWMATLPPEQRAMACMGRGSSLHPEAEIPSDFPPGPERDALIAGMTMRRLTSPEERLKLAGQISDPAIRQQTIDDVNWEAGLRRAGFGAGNQTGVGF